jgi:hypothetical protein
MPAYGTWVGQPELAPLSGLVITVGQMGLSFPSQGLPPTVALGHCAHFAEMATPVRLDLIEAARTGRDWANVVVDNASPDDSTEQ